MSPGKIEAMPRLVLPPSMTPEVSRAHEILGNRARTTILRFIRLNGPSSVNELAEELQAHREAVYVHTRLLEQMGLISATFREGGVHNATYWRLHTDKIKELQQVLIDYIDAK